MLTTFFFSTVCLCFRQCFKSKLSLKPGQAQFILASNIETNAAELGYFTRALQGSG